jgi:hypothetical protein
LAGGLARAGRGPEVAIHGIAADAEDAGTNELEKADQIAVRSREEVGIFVEGAFLVR